MKRSPEFNPRRPVDRRQILTGGDELSGLVGAGMKHEALRLGRRLLKARTIPATVFNVATNAILTLADRPERWRALVEAAHQRVPNRERASVRFAMMSIRNSCQDHEGVLRLIPERFTSGLAPLELICSMEATFNVGDRTLMQRLATRLPHFISVCHHPLVKAQLAFCLAEFQAREGNWAKCIAAAEMALSCDAIHQNAVMLIVEIHVARALLTLRRGFNQIAEFNKTFDPATEIIVPGTEKLVQDQAAKEFGRLQNILHRMIRSARRKELGIG